MKPYERLLEHNIKPSMQRIAIMEYLMNHPIHPSADDIYTALSPSMPTLSKTTVYNTLKLFSEQGAALMLTIDEKNTNFDAELAEKYEVTANPTLLFIKDGQVVERTVGVQKLADLKAIVEKLVVFCKVS
mgnify:CR=1 FL=1